MVTCGCAIWASFLQTLRLDDSCLYRDILWSLSWRSLASCLFVLFYIHLGVSLAKMKVQWKICVEKGRLWRQGALTDPRYFFLDEKYCSETDVIWDGIFGCVFNHVIVAPSHVNFILFLRYCTS